MDQVITTEQKQRDRLLLDSLKQHNNYKLHIILGESRNFFNESFKTCFGDIMSFIGPLFLTKNGNSTASSFCLDNP